MAKSSMLGAFRSLFLVLLLEEAYSYKRCHFYHRHGSSTIITEVRCLSSEYCCDKGCCPKVYTLWYFWTLLLFGLFVALIFCWWYKAHRRRQHITVVERSVIPMQVVQPYPQQPLRGPHQHVEVPHYQVYPHAYAPPPYAVAVNAPPTNQASAPAAIPKP